MCFDPRDTSRGFDRFQASPKLRTVVLQATSEVSGKKSDSLEIWLDFSGDMVGFQQSHAAICDCSASFVDPSLLNSMCNITVFALVTLKLRSYVRNLYLQMSKKCSIPLENRRMRILFHLCSPFLQGDPRVFTQLQAPALADPKQFQGTPMSLQRPASLRYSRGITQSDVFQIRHRSIHQFGVLERPFFWINGWDDSIQANGRLAMTCHVSPCLRLRRRGQLRVSTVKLQRYADVLGDK